MYTDQPILKQKPKQITKKKNEPEIVHDTVCLMVEFVKFSIFTHRRNFKCLVELCKKLRANIAVVKVVQAELASLQTIADLLNQENFETPKFEYKKLRYRLLFTNETPAESEASISDAQSKKQRIKEIKTIVRNEILKSDTVTPNTLSYVLVQYTLSKSQLRYYLNSVKKTMELEGYSFQ